MKCLYCDSDIEGNFCSNCGKKTSNNFSEESFGNIQEHVFNNLGKYISDEFKKEIYIELVGTNMVTMDGLYKTFKKYGYLFRVVEEKFGNFDPLVVKDILSKYKTIRNATDFLDSQSKINSVSLLGMDKKYIIKTEAISIFESYIENNVNYVANQILEEKINGIDKEKLQDNFDYFREMLFRCATWGYTYRLLESASNS